MPEEIDITKLAAMVRTRRGSKGLRAAAADIGGVSPATLSRIEQGRVPDFQTFCRICAWLGVKPAGTEVAETASSTLDKISVHLRADRNLSRESAEALQELINLSYARLVSKPKEPA